MCELIEGENARVCCGCKELKSFNEFHKSKKCKYGVGHRCKACKSEKAAKIKLNLVCQNPKCGNQFVHNRKRKCCFECRRANVYYEISYLKELAKPIGTRNEFNLKYPSEHRWIRTKKLQNAIFPHMPENLSHGPGRTKFINSCNLSYKSGLGTLYLIECNGNNENFYKIGITSCDIFNRYGHCGDKPNNSSMPYYYNILWEIKGDPGQIWDMERDSKTEIKNHLRYRPLIPFDGSFHECFKCEVENSILKRPVLIDTEE